MKAVAVNWTGPERCYRSGGYSIFHKDETGLLNDPKEVLFFQIWGTPKGGTWEAIRQKELETLRPPCPDLACGASQSADLDGLWFECMACGKTFRNLMFRVVTAKTDAEAKEFEKRHHAFDENERAERKFDEIETKIALKARLADIAEARVKSTRTSKEKTEALIRFAQNPPPPPPPPPAPKPKPPVYASLVRFCEAQRAKMKLEAEEQKAKLRLEAQERTRAAFEEWLIQHPEVKAKADRERMEEERLRRESDARATAAYDDWFKRNFKETPGTPRFPSWTTMCPHSVEPRIKMISDIEVSCAACGHAFWGYFHLGAVRRGAKCPCCKGKRVVLWRGDEPEARKVTDGGTK